MNSNKTRKVAIYPNGKRFVIRKVRGGYQWAADAVSSHMDSVIANVEAEGGQIITEENPNYEPPKNKAGWLGLGI
jgi:hypothetical protein